MIPVFNHETTPIHVAPTVPTSCTQNHQNLKKNINKINKPHLILFYPPNLTIKKKKAYLSRYPTDKPRTHHRIAGCFQAPLGTRAPSFSYLPGLFRKSTNSTTSAWWFRCVFCLKQKKTTQHMLIVFFFFWGGGGLGWGVEKFDETCEVIYRMRWNKMEQLVFF